MILEDDFPVHSFVLAGEAASLKNKVDLLEQQNKALRDQVKELEVSLEQAIGPRRYEHAL
jgi:chaperonin cofactor prefoldin|tara:strand:- start:772 stop:951 length:180 start_codon:yes stop_codon:yes gene_type:complete